jgi:hypothetical protein
MAAYILLFKNYAHRSLSVLLILAIGFVITGVIFGSNHLIGFSLLGIGCFIAVIDIIHQAKARKSA